MKVLPHEVLFENALGTLFAGKKQKMNSRRRWLSFVSTPKGSVIVDKGGVKALQKNHSSLLPVGVTPSVRGVSALGREENLRNSIILPPFLGISLF